MSLRCGSSCPTDTQTHTYHGKLVDVKFGSRDSPWCPPGNLLKQSHFCPLAQQVNFICTTQRASTLMFYAQLTSTVRSGQTTQRTWWGGGGGLHPKTHKELRTENYLFFKSATQILHQPPAFLDQIFDVLTRIRFLMSSPGSDFWCPHQDKSWYVLTRIWFLMSSPG